MRLAPHRASGLRRRRVLLILAIVAALAMALAAPALAAEPPTVTKIEPNSGPALGGTPVTITGSGFSGATVVDFGFNSATSFTVRSETSITAVSPVGGATVDVTVTTASGTSSTSAADRFTYEPARTSPGPVSWGNNEYGQLGDRRQFSVNNTDAAVAVSKLGEVTAISAGGYHSLALLPNATAVAWGYNNNGQLGNGSTKNSDVPVSVKGLSKISAISGGGGFSLALLASGTVSAWGYNEFGQLGDGTNTGPSICPAQSEPCSKTPVAVQGLSAVSAIGAGALHSLALLKNGTVMAWGWNAYSQLGDGKTGAEQHLSNVPVPVSGLSEVAAVSAGGEHSLALLKNGTVMAWGSNEVGQLGDGKTRAEQAQSDVPVPVSGLTEVVAIAAGGDHSLALLKNGTVMAWGYNAYGQLGNGTEGGSSDLPVPVGSLTEVSTIAAGASHSLAVLKSGTVMAWGNDGSGQLGDGRSGSLADSDIPVVVSGLSNVNAISGGFEFSLANAR